jgi:hypothetical protein
MHVCQREQCVGAGWFREQIRTLEMLELPIPNELSVPPDFQDKTG